MMTPPARRRTDGLSLIELLIALAIIGIAFLALALSQVNHLRASSRSQVLTTVKTAANQVLEQQTSLVLSAVKDGASGLVDLTQDDGTTLSFKFVDYYHFCDSGANEAGLRTSFRTQASAQANEDNHIGECSGTTTVDNTSVDWTIGPPTSYASYDTEGVLDIAVTATQNNISLTVGNVITCYDVYPSPKLGTPKPCPDPETP